MVVSEREDPSVAPRAAGIAGLGILAQCFLAGYAENAREGISIRGPHKDVQEIATTIRGIVLCFFCSGVVDMIVSLALLAFLQSGFVGAKAGRTVWAAQLSVLLRVAYVLVVMSSLVDLAQVPRWLLREAPAPGIDGSKDDVRGAERIGRQSPFIMAEQLWESFHFGFMGVALGLFGLHLALIAVPLAGGSFTSRTKQERTSKTPVFSRIVLPILLVIAGAGYTGDAVGIFMHDRTFGLTSGGCFIGEVLFMGWLLKTWWTQSSGANAATESGSRPLLE